MGLEEGEGALFIRGKGKKDKGKRIKRKGQSGKPRKFSGGEI